MEEEIKMAEATVSPEAPVQPKRNNLPKIVILLIAIFLIGGGLMFGIQIGKKQSAGGSLKKATPTPIPQPTEIIYTPGETTNWKTYTKDSKKFGSFSIKYPKDWLIVEEKTENPSGEQIITAISKAGYKIEINAFMDGWGPGGCNFDKTIKNQPQISDYDGYLDLGNSALELRRALPPAEHGNILIWSICAKETAGNLFTTAFPFSGTITYFTPTNFNENITKQMDQILSTFRFLDSDSTTQPVEPDGKQIGFIKKAYYQSDQQYIDIDYVEWLSGSAGEKACIEDNKCPEDCSQGHCLPDGYYIRNNNSKTRTLAVVENSTIGILDVSNNFQNKLVDFSTFQKNVSENITKYGAEHNLFWITVLNGKVINMTEQYRP